VPLLRVAKVKGYSYISKESSDIWHILISKRYRFRGVIDV